MRKISLDTNVIISILVNNKNKHRTESEWDGIVDLVREIDQKKAFLVLPTIILTELLPSRLGKENVERLESFFRRRSVSLFDLTYRISRRAGELRDIGKLGSGRVLEAVDAVFIATAETAGADALYSCDRDIYRAQGSTIQLLQPFSPRLSLLPGAEGTPLWPSV